MVFWRAVYGGYLSTLLLPDLAINFPLATILVRASMLSGDPSKSLCMASSVVAPHAKIAWLRRITS